MTIVTQETIVNADKLSQIADRNSRASVIYVPLDEIDVSDRMRPIDSDAVKALVGSITRDGLLSPIDICRLPGESKYKLVAGGHRIEAIRELGWATIPAFKRSSDVLSRQSREIAENIFKLDLSPLDRAAFVARLYSVERARSGLADNEDGRKAGANVRWQKDLKHQSSDANATIAFAYGFTDEVAEKIGLSLRTIQYDLLLFKRLSPSIADRVRKLPIGTNATALRTLAKMEPSDQIKAVTLMEGGAKDINAAQAMMRGAPVADAAKKRLKTFQDTFNRMGRAEQMEALRVLSNVLPKGVDLYFYKNLDERFAKENALVAADRPSAAVASVADRPTNVVDLEDIIRGAAE